MSVWLLVMACGAEPPAPVWVEPAPVWVLSPDASLLEVATLAAERWATAAGVDVRVGEGGIPVLLMPRIIQPKTGLLAWGMSQPREDGSIAFVHVAANGPHPAQSLLHEIGHVLGVVEHIHTGIMAVYEEQEPCIDEASLVSVCAASPCLAFEPEC